ncbi:MAG: ABC transporter ATP-binding protein [Candidatus Nomurabacteria bacterium]|nr:MAG: ABC transporter ATP-binding protein [Candidatus Nomurabacteria bacterium]
MIKADNITRVFKNGQNELWALKGISFEVKEGEYLVITGRSGSGKSTLLYQLGLLDYPTDGDVYIAGVPTGNLDSETRTRVRLESLGYVFQDYAILPSLTALENVMVPLLMQGKSEEFAKQKAEIALGKVGLGDRMDHTPAKLSGGQQQRVAIARALAHEPKIIFADEPTANLDSETAESVLDVFGDLHKSGQTIIMVTHEEEYAKRADRVITLSDGEIVEDKKV